MAAVRQSRDPSIRMFLLGALIALELLMSFSFLGYLHVEPISITFAYVPVLLAGALLGPAEAAVLGGVFGLASMWKASASYVMASDQLFSPFMSGRPLGSLLLSVGARMLFGLLTGLLYLAARKLRRPGIGVAVVSLLGRTIHSFLVYSAMWAFFPEAGYRPSDALWSSGDIGARLSDLIIAVIIVLVWRFFRAGVWQQFQFRVEMARNLQLRERYHRLSLVAIVLVTLCSAFAVAFYFVHRMEAVLGQKGIALPDDGYADLVHLQIQFLIGIIALMALVILFLIFNRWYATYVEHEAKNDALTGAMNRRTFLQMCGRALQKLDSSGTFFGYFIMVDLDRFKEVNDLHGHPEGDRVLREAGRALRETFGRDGLVGRMGGDEFAVLVYIPMPREELEAALRQFQAQIRQIRWGGSQLTCSIGVLPITQVRAAEELYREADRLLYLAKERGRDQYVIGDLPSPEGPKAP